MVGPSGFVDRFKGKTTFDASAGRVAGTPMYGFATQQTFTPTSTGSTVVIPTNPSITVARINASSTTAFIRLPAISFVAQPIAIEIFGVGSTSTAVFITANGSSGTFLGSSYNTLRSTQNMTIELQATSSVNWAIMGTFSTSNASSTGGAYAMTLSTST